MITAWHADAWGEEGGRGRGVLRRGGGRREWRMEGNLGG